MSDVPLATRYRWKLFDHAGRHVGYLVTEFLDVPIVAEFTPTKPGEVPFSRCWVLSRTDVGGNSLVVSDNCPIETCAGFEPP